METTPILQKEIDKVSTSKLILDLKKCTYLTSVTLRALLIARKKYGPENFKVINVSSNVEEILQITGFSSIIDYSLGKDQQETDAKINYISLLKKNVSEHGDEDAYIFLGKHYSWKDIDIGSHIIAHKLAKQGVKHGSHVAIDSPNTINWILTFYAIQKLGAIAILVNFSLKPKEIAVLINTADITHFCYGALPHKIKYKQMDKEIRILCPIIKETLNISPLVNFFSHKHSYRKIVNLYRDDFDPDDASIIIFTSGSTGKPKAVLNSAFNAIKAVYYAARQYELTNSDRNLALLPCFHVFGLALNITIPALCHYRSYIPAHINPDYIIKLINKNKITVYGTVPTMILSLLKSSAFSSEKVSSLRLAFLGGATTTEPQLLLLKDKFPNLHLCNVYGMSENPLISITKYNESIEKMTQTVGKPFDDIQIEIRTNDGKKAEQGVSGEICIKCDSMIICYYKLDIDEQPLDDRGYMATGDLGFIDEDGYLHIVGRTKDLIIRGGENISPREIEEEISKLDYISDVKVLGVPHELLGEEVAAAIILKEGATLNVEKIKATLLKSLAKYKVPTHYVIFDKFPLLGSGKVDVINLKRDLLNKIKEEKK